MAQGKKSFLELKGKMKKDRINELYKAYKKQFRKVQIEKGHAMKDMASKNNFKVLYKIYQQEGIKENTIRTIVRDQRLFTKKQVDTTGRAIRRFLSKNKGKPNSEQFSFMEGVKFSDLRGNSEKAKIFWKELNALGKEFVHYFFYGDEN